MWNTFDFLFVRSFVCLFVGLHSHAACLFARRGGVKNQEFDLTTAHEARTQEEMEFFIGRREAKQ